MKGKTTLKRKIKQEGPPTGEQQYTQSKIVKGKTNLINKKAKKKEESKNPENEKGNSQHLIEQIIVTYFANVWKNKVASLKNKVSNRPNKKAKDTRTLVKVIERAINYHTYLYLIELFDNMSEMPMPSGVEHDPNYGKIFLVKKEEKTPKSGDMVDIEIGENTIIDNNKNLRNKTNKGEKTKEKKYKKEEDDDGLAIYMYRNDGSPLDRVEIEKDIDRLIEENPEKDIDVERILKSKRLQYKLKNPRFSPFTKKENLDSFVRYMYTYKPGQNTKDKNENVIVIKNKTFAYY